MIAASTDRGAARTFNLHESRCATWSGRSEAAVALWLSSLSAMGDRPPAWTIADLGCGDEKLRDDLSRTPLEFEYFGYDLLPQSQTCQRLDLAREVPNRKFDVVFCLGVLEYLADVPRMLARLRQISPRVVVSYVTADAGAYAPQDVAAKAWLHHFTAAELDAMFFRAGFACRGKSTIDGGRTQLWSLEVSGPAATLGDYSMLTPFPIPPELCGAKVANLGDGFIERAIANRLQPRACQVAYSTRVPLTDEAIDRINQTSMLLVAGANQLNDNYCLVPGMTAERLARIRVPIIPVGVGVHGIASYTQDMSAETKTLLRALHERIRYSSWRCPATVEYLLKHCPELADQALMTGCPVTFGEPLLNGRPFPKTSDRIVVTVTERHDFWEREARTIDFVARQFPRAEKTLSLHQSFPPNATTDRQRSWSARLLRRPPRTPGRLHEYARRRGFNIFSPGTVAEGQRFYVGCDLHVGSRLHAHLYFLSQAKRSFLSYVDDRSAGMARSLCFPLGAPAAWGRSLDYDFEQYRAAARRCHQSMARFLTSLDEPIG